VNIYPQGVIRYEGINEVNYHGITPANFRIHNNAMYTAAKAAAPGCRSITGAVATWGYYGQNTNPTGSGP
jgi:hypothetical protein